MAANSTGVSADADVGIAEKAKAIGLKIYKPTINDYKLKALFYGEPGVGKTTLAATACNVPRMQDTLVLNIEGGVMSVIDAGDVGIDTTPDVFDVEKWDDFKEAYYFLTQSADAKKYKTLIIDSYSELAKMNLDLIVQQETAKGGKRTNIDQTWLEDYGASTKQMRRITRAFRDLDMHVLLTCHALASQDHDKNEQVTPSITPKLRESVMGFMDVVGMIYTREKEKEGTDGREKILERVALFQPFGKWSAKDRSPGGRLGITMANPTMPKIFDRITNVTTEKEDND